MNQDTKRAVKTVTSRALESTDLLRELIPSILSTTEEKEQAELVISTYRDLIVKLQRHCDAVD